MRWNVCGSKWDISDIKSKQYGSLGYDQSENMRSEDGSAGEVWKLTQTSSMQQFWSCMNLLSRSELLWIGGTGCHCVWWCTDEPTNEKKPERAEEGTGGWADAFQNKHFDRLELFKHFSEGCSRGWKWFDCLSWSSQRQKDAQRRDR